MGGVSQKTPAGKIEVLEGPVQFLGPVHICRVVILRGGSAPNKMLLRSLIDDACCRGHKAAPAGEENTSDEREEETQPKGVHPTHPTPPREGGDGAQDLPPLFTDEESSQFYSDEDGGVG
ncbi:uncharacterized protein [Procambarus clarkii]|uniref:uncharacterized protein n=1 Tax=Procambarus clarkii TaxID=6728 RepID=UPI0037447667